MNMTSDDAARHALLQADSVLATKGRSFHWARHLLGAEHAARATRLYRFCRHVDDLADEADCIDRAKAALHAVRDAIITDRSSDPIVGDMLRLMQACHIDPVVPLNLIAGVAGDLELVSIADEAALLRYCYQVAGTVGLMMCSVLDVNDPAAFPHAIDLGIGMQLINISRDIAEDAAAGRRYLPQPLVRDMALEDLIMPPVHLQPGLRYAVQVMLDRADMHYLSGEQGLAYLPVRARFGILVAARVYRAIGQRLRRADYAYWQGRTVVPTTGKATVTARSLLIEPLRPQFWRVARQHNGALHDNLVGLPGVIARPSIARPETRHAG